MAAKYLGKLDDLEFEKSGFPVEDTNFETPQYVLDVGHIRPPRYRGH